MSPVLIRRLSATTAPGGTILVHEARTDFSMWLGLVLLLTVGVGMLFLDASLVRRSASPATSKERE